VGLRKLWITSPHSSPERLFVRNELFQSGIGPWRA
jgi:hypothetical protein